MYPAGQAQRPGRGLAPLPALSASPAAAAVPAAPAAPVSAPALASPGPFPADMALLGFRSLSRRYKL